MRRVRWLFGALALLLCQACTGRYGSRQVDGAVDTANETSASLCSASCMTGCCAGTVCQAGNEDSACGSNGRSCIACDPAYHCEDGYCMPGARACNAANCSDGCCTASGECLRPSNQEHCGLNGRECATCVAGASCTEGTCASSCASNCPQGCCSATGACIDPATDENCGTAGQRCVKCDTASQFCQGGSCATKTQPGTCNSSTCADGCCDDGTCVRFGEQSGGKCGKSAEPCRSCADSDPCTNETCSSGTCSNPPKGDGENCANGRCRKGACCTGCWDGESCQLGLSLEACGQFGNDCIVCRPLQCHTPPLSCIGWSCGGESVIEDGNPGFDCDGKCWSGGTCCSSTQCWNGSECVDGTSGTECGSNGDACEDCESQGSSCVDQSCQSE